MACSLQPPKGDLISPPSCNETPRLHVNAGATCNNNCVFCAEDDRAARARLVGSQTFEELVRIMAEFACREHLCFTTGEPTLNPRLPELIEEARRLGYQEIALITNGRRLSDPAYLERLVSAGLNLLTISIHGGRRKLHDGLTRTPGSFVQTVAGLRNAAPRLRVHTSTVITVRNVGSLKPLLALLGRFGVRQAVLNVVKPRGRADTRAVKLLPHYREISRAVAASLASLGPASPPIFLEDLPLCATEDLPDSIRGVLEFNLRYDPLDDKEGRRFEEFDRQRTEQGQRTKSADCRRCRYDEICPGVWRRYLAVYGWDGLDPVD